MASAGHWGFPKGNKDENESDQQGAIRELEEEAGISSIKLLNNKSFTESYSFERNGIQYNKSVKYFIGLVSSTVTSTPDNFKQEIPELRWVSYKDAKQLFIFPERKEILNQAFEYLNNK